jgi:hypothetical protein
MRFAIRINGPERMRSADVENENTLKLRRFDDFGSVRCYELPGATSTVCTACGSNCCSADIPGAGLLPTAETASPH